MKILHIVLLLIVVSISSSTLAQIQDSLWSVWTNEDEPDTVRVDALYDYTWANYMFLKPYSANIFARVQVEFAKKLNDSEREIKALYTYGGSFLMLSENDSGIFYLDKIYQLALKDNNSRWVVKSAMAIGGLHYQRGEFSQAEAYFVEGIESIDSNISA